MINNLTAPQIGSGKKRAGFTLTEILVVFVVAAILVSIALPGYHRFKKAAEKVECIANLRILHGGFDSYMLENKRWPQMPPKYLEGDESLFFEFWIVSLEPHGVVPENWKCPSDKVVREELLEDDKYYSSYVATRFNPMSTAPFIWNQPWVAERGDFHGKGAHILMPDGSVNPSQNPFAGR